MSKKKIFHINSYMIKRININQFFILLLLSKLAIISKEDNEGINAPYPVALQLNNNNLFIANRDGMHFCDQNLESIKSHEYYNKNITDFNNILNKVLISQFKEGNVICLIEDVFYLFEENGNFLIMGEFPTEIIKSSYLNLLAYKKDTDNNFHFIITFMDSYNRNIFLYHYKTNINIYNIVSNYSYNPFYFDYPNIVINNQLYTCQIMDSDKKGSVLTCCFQTYAVDLIVLQSFDIENNLTEIEEYYAKTPISCLTMVTSTISEDKKNILVFFSASNHFSYYFSYNYDTNKISNYKVVAEECLNNFAKYKVNYFKEKQEYLFICENRNKFIVIKIDKDFKLLNPDEITTANFEILNHFSFNSLSLIYDINAENYAIISDPINTTVYQSFTSKYFVTTNFSESFKFEEDKPEDFVEQVQNQDLTLKETNRYYVYVENYKTVVFSNESLPLIINFTDENNLFIKTKKNTTIDPFFYSFYIKIESTIGRLTAEIDGEEKELGEINYLPNITHVNYYPVFSELSSSFSFNLVLYLMNKTIASKYCQVFINICQENCSCTINSAYCAECLVNYIPYLAIGNCISADYINGKFYDEEAGIYKDCYKMCKTCSKISYLETDMGCLSCYEEYGDYMEYGTNQCYEKNCDNLYYRDKDTNMKICIDGDSCPDEYPNLNTQTKKCERDEVYSTNLASSTNLDTSDSIKESDIENEESSNDIEGSSSPNIKDSSSTFEEFTSSKEIFSDSSASQPPSSDIEDPTSKSEQPSDSSTSETITNSKESFLVTEEQSSKSYQPFDSQLSEPSSNLVESTLATEESILNGDQSSDSAISEPLTNQEESTFSNTEQLFDFSTTEISASNNEQEPSHSSTPISQISPFSTDNSIESTIVNDLESILSETNIVDDDYIYEKIMNLINEIVGKENIDQINKTYSALSNTIKNGNISSFSKDVTIIGKNITYQITTSENQKNSNHKSNVSVIDLGECEKIIKKNISYENDPTPLLILKIDVKKGETKSTAVEYEVYNPYTREKIDLSICSDTSIAIYAPVNLNARETSLYDDLSQQGYNLFDVNNSFYIDPCAPYTSSNGTDVSLADRKNYYYSEDTILCEDSCKYIEVNTKTEKVLCNCSIKNEVNIDNDQEFSPQKLLEKFYKVDTYSNFEVLYCYKLVFDLKNLKKNICFYIMIVLLTAFLTSMIVNLIIAMKKIDEIIFKIFQDRFMYYFLKKIIVEGKQKRRGNINLIKGPSLKLGWLERLKMSKNKKQNESSQDSSAVINNKNLYNLHENEMKIIKYNIHHHKNKEKKLKNDNLNSSNIRKENDNNNNEKLELKDKKLRNKSFHVNHNKNYLEKNELNNNENNNNEKNIKTDDKNEDNKKSKKNLGNININIINNIINKKNPPKKNNGLLTKDTKIEEKSLIKDENPKKLEKNRSKNNKKKLNAKEILANSSISNSTSIIKLKKIHEYNKHKINKTLLSIGDSLIEEKIKKKKKKKKKKTNLNKKEKEKKLKEEENKKKNIKYIDEELNRMNYIDAIENDKRTYCQYYWSLLKKKHMIVLTFVSLEDYNVFTLKFSLFILSIALYFSINTLFYSDNSMHQIFTEKGKYNLIYQIPQVIYSTLISFFMTLILKTLSLSQNELIVIKKELDQDKSKALADKSKKCMKIKLYSFFFLGLALLIFFCYYISAFAAVYTNTQLHLIKDTLLSFGISMSYPFVINLFPGIFRLYALKSEKQDKECLFQAGQLLALI